MTPAERLDVLGLRVVVLEQELRRAIDLLERTVDTLCRVHGIEAGGGGDMPGRGGA
jgi:hypothetical protein